jgi:hypothetical protein
MPSMKTFYLIKYFLPAFFLPIAPGVVQMELARQGIHTFGGSVFAVILQIVLTLGIIAWVAQAVNRKAEKKAFLRMSCVSKKVYHREKWITVEQYLAEYHNVVVSHGMTPEESTAWLRESEEYVKGQTQEIFQDRETALRSVPELVSAE